jgi:multidrug efflux system membrane fusion protein
MAAVLMAACGSEASTEQTPPPPRVSAAEVVIRDVQQWDEYTGHIQAVDTVELRPRVNGHIERINFVEGSEVEKGQVLFVIDQRPYRAALARAQAELERAAARTELARKDLTRAEQLAGARAISAEELDQRRTALAEAQASLRVAEAAVDVAELDLAFTEVRAPISGRVGHARVSPGNLVSSQPGGTPLTTIVSLDPVHVYFEHDEQTYQRYNTLSRNGQRTSARNGHQPVRVGLAGEPGFPHSGQMDFVDNRVDPSTGTIRARAVLPNPDRTLTPGMFARVRVLGGAASEAGLVDDKAVLTDQDRRYVYVIGEDGRARRRDVQLGRMAEGLRVVESGLSAGDRVIVHGVQKVFFPGMPVQAQSIAMGDPPPAPPSSAAN